MDDAVSLILIVFSMNLEVCQCLEIPLNGNMCALSAAISTCLVVRCYYEWNRLTDDGGVTECEIQC